MAKFFLNSFRMLNRSISLLETITRMRVWSSVPAPFGEEERQALFTDVTQSVTQSITRPSWG